MSETAPPTNRSIDERVARVEENVKVLSEAVKTQGSDVAALKTSVEVVRAEQGHLTTLVTSTSAENRTANALLVSKIDNLSLQAAQQKGIDLKSDEEFLRVSKTVDDHKKMLAQMTGMAMFVKFAVGGSLLGLIIGIVTLYLKITGG